MEHRKMIAALKHFIYGDPTLTSIFSKYMDKNKWKKEESQIVMDTLSDMLLKEEYTSRIAEVFSPLLLEFITRKSKAIFLEISANNCETHEWLCICLSKLIWNNPEIRRYVKMYFEKSKSIFWRYEEEHLRPVKKQKTGVQRPRPDQLLKAAYLFLLYDTSYFKSVWSWTVIVRFLNDVNDLSSQWYAHLCLGQLAGIKEHRLHKNMQTIFKEPEYTVYIKELFEICNVWGIKSLDPKLKDIWFNCQSEKASQDLIEATASVCNVCLNKNESQKVPSSSLICVQSIQVVLHSLALAVSVAEPVLIQGPVGCGKTSLVEHLAMLTGKKHVKDFLKIQLGDHVDSKMLLGAHVCSEIPGQFVWKPGILTKAMIEGRWLLLEDIDSAPMDVVSMLNPVLQSRSIVLPGHPKPIKAAPGFQLFATQRLLNGIQGSYIELRSNADVISKRWRKLTINSLNGSELAEVISAKWKKLEPFISGILSMYSTFSACIHQDSTEEIKSSNTNFFGHGRLTSMRDLFKFCNRISEKFELKSENTGVNVFMNAIDCFSDNIPDPKSRLTAAELLCPNVNLSSTKALYFCQNYKPQIKLHIDGCVVIGRICLPKKPEEVTKIISFKRVNKRPMSTFANTRIATVLLEKVAACIYYKEPVLLVGETGTGKTSIVQHLAELTNRKLTVINMSQQSDSVDLIGGYKPADMIHIIQPIKDEFDCLFPKSMDAKVNAKFLAHVSNCFYNKKFSKLFAVILHAQKNVMKLLANQRNEEREELLNRWTKLGEKVHNFDQQLKQSKPTIAFRFIEGALVKAMREGEWLLLDEINLAEAETLECLAGVLDNDDSLILLERGDSEPVKRHPDFRIFACMNPATDVGKKDLPIGIRSRFTEFFVDEVSDTTDLKILVHEYLKNLDIRGRGNLTRDQAIQKTIDDIVKFYKKIKDSAIAELTDGRGASPHYSLRTLCRALKYGSSNFFLSARRSLYEAFCLSFLTQLDNNSHEIVTKYVTQYLIEGKDSILKQAIPEPKNGAYVNIAGYWILKGDQEPEEKENYIFTETVRRNLRDLARIVCAGRFPVLLQGETSCGKTSLIQYLAKATGNVCVRVNNHEHTDIQEYVGTYTTDEKGNLFFKEGILVEAMRNGYWIILDELNLAPTEVMEALNRVLDDNRELFIAETQEVVQAKNGFMLFATQNPAGSYGGRKVLSRAFRNRFIELHFVDIPDPELKEILAKRCQLPSSYSNKLVSIMRDLQKRRRESHLFAGKLGFITLRDLFRWGERYQYAVDPPAKFYDWDQHLAEEGYLLLAGRVRLPQEAKIIQQSIQKVFKRTVDPDSLFNLSTETPFTTKSILEKIVNTVLTEPLSNIVWTRHMRRLAVLVGKALEFNEPVLLIGNTGCGKTTMCQIFAQIFGKKMYSVNCHMHSESSDFLGGLRPVRDAAKRQIKLFEWVDGPLVNAMIEGCYFLMDEISLADDSVLERLNSVLEPEQKIFLTEKGLDSSTSCEITAKKGFQFFATMNPGGDYGKKELSPALRNRLTEIWCPNNLETKSDIIEFVENNIREEWSNGNFEQFKFGESIADFIEFYCQTSFRKTTSVTARDVLTWLEFINTYAYKGHSPIEGYLHGAFLVFLDSVSTGEFSAYDTNLLKQFENRCCEFLESQVDFSSLPAETTALATLGNDDFSAIPIGVLPEGNKQSFGIGPFHIEFGMPSHEASNTNYDFFAKTPKSNAFKILRAMQLPKPILLEGSPGVGKTSLIEVLAKISGHDLVRINLSEQTDISDLFGADLPVEGGKAGEFAWRDGPLLQALKKNHWILLDELNLASQSVLEGLNACLDHRSEIYISELGYTLKLDKTLIRIFGCMNPHQQGGSRKGLPQSFLNRFTRVNIRRMEASDFRHIVSMIYPQIPQKLVRTMINFNEEITLLVNERKALEFYGSPFEFNLRDILRWCEAVVKNQPEGKYDIGEYVTLLYMDRMKTDAHKNTVYKIYKRCVDCSFHNDDQQLMVKRPLQLRVYANSVQLGYSTISCVGKSAADTSLITVPLGQLPVLESIMKCIEMNWMPILIGSEGSGKTSLIRLLAQLSGHYLHTMSVNSEMDIMELLGGFEQADVDRKIESVAHDLEPLVQEAVFQCVVTHQDRCLDKILTDMHLLSGVKQKPSSELKLRCLHRLIAAINHVFKVQSSSKQESSDVNITVSQKYLLNACSEIVDKLSAKVEAGSNSTGGQFEWVDSILINAAKKGDWLLIDDANFCSPSVLDRLNSLLEPGGVLTITEQGVVQGDLRTIKPHPDFRIFLTMNPRNGEISRAMRNRGVEIYVAPINERDTEPWMDYLNVSLLSESKGLNHTLLTTELFRLHSHLQYLNMATISDYFSAASLFAQFLKKHETPKAAFLKTCLSVYVKNQCDSTCREKLTSIIYDFTRGFPEKILTDISIPIINLLPNTIDYRHSSITSLVKRHAAVFTHFMSHLPKFLRRKEEEGFDERNIYYPYPVSNFPNRSRIRDRFFCIIRILIESSTIQLNTPIKYLDVFLQSIIKQEIEKLQPNAALKDLMLLCSQFISVLVEQLNSPIVTQLIDTVTKLFSLAAGFNKIRREELTIDPRWMPNVYNQLLCCVKKNNDSEVDVICLDNYANKFSLLLLLRTLEFNVSSIGKMPNMYSLLQTEKLSQFVKDNRIANVLRRIPAFLENVPCILLEMLNKKGSLYNDDYYWKFRDILHSFYACRLVCEEQKENFDIQHQLNVFTTHFYWLRKKIDKLEEEIPLSLPSCFEEIDSLLEHKTATRTFRLKFVKKSKYIPGFSTIRAAEIYKNAIDLYKHINLYNRLNVKEPSMHDLKIIFSNKQDWMKYLAKVVYKSVFSAVLEYVCYNREKLTDIKVQLHSANLMPADDVMEISEDSTTISPISDEKIVAEIQIMPLLDYIFNIYTAEILHKTSLEVKSELLFKLGYESLCADPKHLAHILRYVKHEPNMDVMSPSFVVLMTSFLNHQRHGFSSEGLRFVNSHLVNGTNGNTIAAPVLEWNAQSIWFKQAPLLTYICASLYDKCHDSTVCCHSSTLGQYEAKNEQLKKVNSILWKNFEKLANPRHSFRLTTANAITYSFFGLISGVALIKKCNIRKGTYTIEHIKELFKNAGIDSLVITAKKRDVLDVAFESIKELRSALKGQHDTNFMWRASKAYIFVGLLTKMLLIPNDAVDPNLKRTIKVQDNQKKMDDLANEHSIRDWIARVNFGLTLDETISLDCAPYLKKFTQMCKNTNMKIEALGKNIICRQGDIKFEKVVETLHNYMTDVGSPDDIINIFSGLSQVFVNRAKNMNVMDCDAILRAQTVIDNQRSFVETKSKEYFCYGDITTPFFFGIEQVMVGLQLAIQSIQLDQINQKFQSKHYQGVTNFLSQFISFPIESYCNSLDAASLLLNGENIQTFRNLLSFCKVPSIKADKLICKLLKSGVHEIINEIRINPPQNSAATHTILPLLMSALKFFWNAWDSQETEKKRKQEEEDSLYRHKEKHHEGELTEEEAINQKISTTFPSFRNEFADCFDADIDREENKLDNLSSKELQITPNDAFEIWQFHSTIMSILCTELNNPDENMKWVINKSKTPDYSTSYLLRYEVICEIVKYMPDKLEGILDDKLAAGHLLMSHELRKLHTEKNAYYDIYHSPNPTEVLTLKPILDNLEYQLKEMLEKKHPDEPQLLQVLKIVNRVLSFPVTDPLMKFVIGLELILETMQQWKRVLKKEKAEIAKKIIQYRSLELDCWRKGLDCVIRKQYVNCSKWWFHLYGLFSTPDQNSINKEAFDSQINSLKQFLDESPLGEFSPRLSILHTFLQQFKLSKTLLHRKLTAVLLNIYHYYEQFLPDVKNRISQIRKPIDKELKDFVKIARWNDINFEALKQSVKKSHRFVVKHVKTFEDALKLPAKKIFTIPSKKDLETSDGPSWALNIKEKDFLLKSEEKVDIEYFHKSDKVLFQKLPHCHKRMTKFSKKLSKSFAVLSHINTLNDFCGTILEALESVTIDSGKNICTRSQEKKQILLLIQKKKQMLSTLFKNLRVIGLSYGQGRIFAKNNLKASNILLTMPSFDTCEMDMLKFDLEFKDLLLKVSQDTNHYFYKSIAQYALFQKYMELPCKDLTLDIIQKIDGYSGNLIYHVATQRETIVRIAKSVDKIGCFLSSLSNLQKSVFDNSCIILPPEKDVLQQENVLNNLMVRFMMALHQFGMLMECAPSPSNGSDDMPSLIGDQNLLCSFVKDDLKWTEVVKCINESSAELENHFQRMCNSASNTSMFTTWERFSQTVENFKILMMSVYTVGNTIRKPGFKREQHPTLSLDRLSDKVQKEFLKAQERYNAIHCKSKIKGSQDCTKNITFNSIVQKLTKEVLLAYQDVVALCKSSNEINVSDDMCPENLFTVRITACMSDFEKCLRFQTITKLLNRLKKRIQQNMTSLEDIKAINDSLRLLLNLTPVLNQYFQLVKVYLAVHLGMHRTSCKFLTILLEIFNLLATKGFCIPADLEEEAKKSDETKFEDFEAGGFDDGEGVKDVSEKIESEDQLEGASKEGQEKEENKDQNDIKEEEKGIEMSDDFEGKSYNPDEKQEESEESDNEEGNEDLDKQMGDVDTEEAEKLDEKMWGSDSEDEEEDLNDANDTGGVTENRPSEMVAKDDMEKDSDNTGKKDMPQETMPDEQNDEYQGEAPDPLIDAPVQEPEVVELPEDMEITDDVDKEDGDGDGEPEEMEMECVSDEDLESKEVSEETEEDTEKSDAENNANKTAQEEENITKSDSVELAEENDDTNDKTNESNLPTHSSTAENEALPSEQTQSSSQDPVQEDSEKDWEGSGQRSDEQHKGQSETNNPSDQSAANESGATTKRKRSSTTEEEEQQKPNKKLGPPDKNRTVDDSADTSNIKQRPVADQHSTQKSLSSEDPDDSADVYEHVKDKEEGVSKAVDVATEEQAAVNPADEENETASDDDEVIEISSDDDDEAEQCNQEEFTKTKGDVCNKDKNRKPGNYVDDDEDTVPEGEVVRTHMAARGDSTMHTNFELWKSMSDERVEAQREAMKQQLIPILSTKSVELKTEDALNIWKKYENLTLSLSQELCEQLRLVLEPTKTSKLKGDYRTGKRLNMRKIIPYIASQYQKDKIWLRRTKPSKRQYQIMLAVDVSNSMCESESCQLAFETLSTLGQSLSLLEAGELSVIKFGEKVELLLDFNEQFNTETGARIFQQLKFDEQRTCYNLMVEYATQVMTRARNRSAMMSKETSQLLIILSDGRNVFGPGKEKVLSAIREAKKNNIFMIFIIFDSPTSKESIFDSLSVINFPQGNSKVEIVPYLQLFPFPFYLALRSVAALPAILGEALRQWFELVTATER